MNTVAVIDFETTGLRAGDRAIEVAVVVLQNGRVVERFESLMMSKVRISPKIEELTGISNDMIRQAPPSHEVMRELVSHIQDIPLIAHNAAFDKRFLDAELSRIGGRRKQDFICSMLIARRVYPNAPDHKLTTLVKYADIPIKQRAHRAMADARMTVGLWLKMQQVIRKRHNIRYIPLDMIKGIQTIQRGALGEYIRTYKKSNII